MGPHPHTPWDPTLTPRGTPPSHAPRGPTLSLPLLLASAPSQRSYRYSSIGHSKLERIDAQGTVPAGTHSLSVMWTPGGAEGLSQGSAQRKLQFWIDQVATALTPLVTRTARMDPRLGNCPRLAASPLTPTMRARRQPSVDRLRKRGTLSRLRGLAAAHAETGGKENAARNEDAGAAAAAAARAHEHTRARAHAARCPSGRRMRRAPPGSTRPRAARAAAHV